MPPRTTKEACGRSGSCSTIMRGGSADGPWALTVGVEVRTNVYARNEATLALARLKVAGVITSYRTNFMSFSGRAPMGRSDDHSR